MNRFHHITPPNFIEYFVREDEANTFAPSDWILPFPWISMFVYTHINSSFWGSLDNTDENNRPKILQVGCAEGTDAIAIANVLKLPMINGILHVVDWFKGNLTVDPSEDWAYNEENAERWRSMLEMDAADQYVSDIITVFEGDSREILPTLQDEYYDMVFIDGGHEYSIVKADIENGYKKLKRGGIMVLDDISATKEQYYLYDLPNVTADIIEKDTHRFSDGHNIHAGVVKAFYEFFGDDYIGVPSHAKAYHIKK
jgi:hypothetical protein